MKLFKKASIITSISWGIYSSMLIILYSWATVILVNLLFTSTYDKLYLAIAFVLFICATIYKVIKTLREFRSITLEENSILYVGMLPIKYRIKYDQIKRIRMVRKKIVIETKRRGSFEIPIGLFSIHDIDAFIKQLETYSHVVLVDQEAQRTTDS